jgi:hypothetical protein
MADYITIAELKASLGITDSVDDTALTRALTFASRAVDKHCRRRFTLDGSATARTFKVNDWRCLYVDDFSTLTGLIVATDDNGDGTFETTWTITTDYLAGPFNNLVDGRALTKIEAVGGRSFPRGLRPGVQITAKWGWPAVPEEVKQATLLIAARLFRRKDSPSGVAGSGEFGVVRVSRYEDPDACMLLADFIRPLI